MVEEERQDAELPSEAHVMLALQPDGPVRELNVAVASDLGASRLRRRINRLAQNRTGRDSTAPMELLVPGRPSMSPTTEGLVPTRLVLFCTQPKRKLLSQFELIR